MPLPDSSEMSISRWLPTISGSMCSNVAGSAVDPGDVHAALVGERVATHVGRVGIGREVEQLGDVVGRRRQRRQLGVGEALVAELELEVGDDRDEVGVAAALAVAVHRALDVGGPRHDPRPARWPPRSRRRHGCGCPPAPRSPATPRRRLMAAPTDVGQRAAVGVAAHHGLGAGLGGGAQAAQRVVAVVGVAVEEVLGVVDRPACPAPPGRPRTRRSSAGSRRGRP